MNYGAGQCAGDVLLFLHCDTRLPRDALRRVEEAVARGYVWGRFDIVLDDRRWIYRVIETMINLRSRIRRLATGDQAVFVQTEAFNRCGGFPEIPLMEDIAICKRLNAMGRPTLIRAPVTTSARRWRNRGPIRTILLMWKMRFLFWIGADPKKLAMMYRDER